MNKIAIVTDSTAYIPESLLKKHTFHIVPLQLIWGQETFLDGVDIMPSDFYARLKNAKVMPSTSQPSPMAFEKIFKQLIEEEYQILAVLISEKLSGTIDSAQQARSKLDGAAIEIVDSQNSSMALGFQALAAAQAVQNGASLAECKKIVEKCREHTGLIFAVDTLEFLHRGGRIGGASRFLGTALNIKPILEVSGGRVEPLERVRTRSKSIERLVELVEARTAGRSPLHLSVLHANAQKDAEELARKLEAHFKPQLIVVAELSPVIGTHTGPGTLGIAYSTGL